MVVLRNELEISEVTNRPSVSHNQRLAPGQPVFVYIEHEKYWTAPHIIQPAKYNVDYVDLGENELVLASSFCMKSSMLNCHVPKVCFLPIHHTLNLHRTPPVLLCN